MTGAEDLLPVALGNGETQTEIDRFFGYLQWTREGLREFPFPSVLWVTPLVTLCNNYPVFDPTFGTLNGHAQDWVAPLIRSDEVIVNKNTSDSRSKSASISWGVLKIEIDGMNLILCIDRT